MITGTNNVDLFYFFNKITISLSELRYFFYPVWARSPIGDRIACHAFYFPNIEFLVYFSI